MITITITEKDIRELADAANSGNALGEAVIVENLAVAIIAALANHQERVSAELLNSDIEALIDSHARVPQS